MKIITKNGSSYECVNLNSETERKEMLIKKVETKQMKIVSKIFFFRDSFKIETTC